MHYYQFNIADYRKDTGHLTPVEHYIYRWLIDEYHLSEFPIENNMPRLLRRMSLEEDDRHSLELILEEFFEGGCDDDWEGDTGNIEVYFSKCRYPHLTQYWVHRRIDQDIEKYRDFIRV